MHLDLDFGYWTTFLDVPSLFQIRQLVWAGCERYSSIRPGSAPSWKIPCRNDGYRNRSTYYSQLGLELRPDMDIVANPGKISLWVSKETGEVVGSGDSSSCSAERC